MAETIAHGYTKMYKVLLYPHGKKGSPLIYENVTAWKVSADRTLVLEGIKWTEVILDKEWGWMRAEEA
jgi:hypothetical protein